MASYANVPNFLNFLKTILSKTNELRQSKNIK